MTLWDKFFESGRIEDYLTYAAHRKEDTDNADLYGTDTEENDRGETSKSVTVLTAERGVIDIFVRGGRKSTKNASSTQLFAYSKLCVEEKKNAKDQSMFFLNSSESEKLFYNIRLDPKKTALASTFLSFSCIYEQRKAAVTR